jgi:hypothetical protein
LCDRQACIDAAIRAIPCSCSLTQLAERVSSTSVFLKSGNRHQYMVNVAAAYGDWCHACDIGQSPDLDRPTSLDLPRLANGSSIIIQQCIRGVDKPV